MILVSVVAKCNECDFQRGLTGSCEKQGVKSIQNEIKQDLAREHSEHGLTFDVKSITAPPLGTDPHDKRLDDVWEKDHWGKG